MHDTQWNLECSQHSLWGSSSQPTRPLPVDPEAQQTTASGAVVLLIDDFSSNIPETFRFQHTLPPGCFAFLASLGAKAYSEFKWHRGLRSFRCSLRHALGPWRRLTAGQRPTIWWHAVCGGLAAASKACAGAAALKGSRRVSHVVIGSERRLFQFWAVVGITSPFGLDASHACPTLGADAEWLRSLPAMQV